MRGKSEPVGMYKKHPLEILIKNEQYSMERWKYTRRADDHVLEYHTHKILDVFRNLERAVNTSKKITLEPELCEKQLVGLAKWGMSAYQKFFDEEARSFLRSRIIELEYIPTFVSDRTPFPWEILYEGDEYTTGDPTMFWGLRYTPARILNEKMDYFRDYPAGPEFPLDMLFCLHHKLLQSHQQERPAIEQSVRKGSQKNRFSLLGGTGWGLAMPASPKTSGEVLLEYLDTSTHNMVHFACHCRRDSGEDTLVFSLINDERVDNDIPTIRLQVSDFGSVTGKFTLRPLVFLNACQSGGTPDKLGKTFNLPNMFIEHHAAAVIATICPIPDLFAAAFAREFYKYFLEKHMTIGDALRATRKYFIKEHNNPLGLAYGLYSPAHYQLATPPGEGGARS